MYMERYNLINIYIYIKMNKLISVYFKLLSILVRKTGHGCPSSSIVLLQSVQQLACLQGMNIHVLVLGDRQTTQ